ncbi:2-amino-4-hydroxy-6-hydroxymethyldihydropteridine diphosphokinase [Colwellia sp. 4_MG-2023]|jgi:2-amino-4-hydroxy-6-hydroxymethyldihydropteridine diphosphokinase|uniref:2-amino-4-hydroxy-6- hydroxymethyldihydropteridine diphosphokinase n=1 Tax=unclassified Colwellia TaxID=196834 RepID=UPI001C090453|nr:MULTISPECIES: 2-amino-4-hydroxy-6-hydroxymethyldihydropteridine diphosphokinase [unclassified Colwellia]MBU2925072.1 2-amino-4-hydroxy-6-hydroxymethyldihydropteridine diphosphokinase [Colwellia sp. C2M11]MDO6486477.1 2-amino-4-hydroxy-6-hydroxymethyldihydropteridine diphosphokinase [Colwellia sp. 6_MG-2023]MDO6506355.1 2-amino-4-hydroxy-6-hydroxymethyldihydropteridine diphosphokinase [Colwellia sp. 5_MG-2023]MDO6555179.1 2-amino-4-hydroxy-6-hydroxymethyldihydropteridine diphosphokinase [Colw
MTTTSTIAYIGLGSNLSEPIEQVKNAIKAIRKITQSSILSVSSLYLSKPMGPQDQDNYINAVLSLETSLSPIELLDALQAIENEFGRVRKENRWGARILDLDILLFGNQVINSERLVIPHYGMTEREFVLIPLAEISPLLQLPNGQNISSLSQNISVNSMIKLSEY